MEREPNDQQTNHAGTQRPTQKSMQTRGFIATWSRAKQTERGKKAFLKQLKGCWWEDGAWEHAAKNNNKFINKVRHAQDYGGFVK